MRRLTLSLSIVAIALVATGCGGDDDNSKTTAAPTTNIVALADSTPQLAFLAAALKAAPLATDLNGKGPFTVFAPTNQALKSHAEFGNFPDKKTGKTPANTAENWVKRDKEAATATLLYHVVQGLYKTSDLKNGQELTTVQGEKLKVKVDGSTIKIVDGTDGEATIVGPEIEASNGVVHVVDDVLVPLSVAPIATPTTESSN